MSETLTGESSAAHVSRERLIAPQSSAIAALEGARLAMAAIASALLLCLSLPPLDAYWIGPLALAPWLYSVRRATAWRRAWSGALLGTAQGLAMAWWIAPAIAALGSAGSAVTRSLAAALTIFLFMGIPWAVIGVASEGAGLGFAARVVACVLAVDWARSSLFPVPAWGLLGHSQWSSGLAQLAALGGVPLVSGATAAVSALWVLAIDGNVRPSARRGSLRLACLASGVCLSLMALGESAARSAAGPAPAPAGSMRILLVQPHLPGEERWIDILQETHLDLLIRQTSEALNRMREPPDLVLWPETALTAPIDRDRTLRSKLEAAVARMHSPLASGVVRIDSEGSKGRYRSAAVRIDPRLGITDVIDKARAVPILESDSWLAHALGETILAMPALRPMVVESAESQKAGERFEIVPVLCYEVFFPGLVAGRRSANARSIIDFTSDSWSAPLSAIEQQIAFASFRAVEQRLPLVRVSHGGPSVVFDAYGRIVDRLPAGREAALWTELAPPRSNPAREAGGLALLALGGALAGCAVHSILIGGTPR